MTLRRDGARIVVVDDVSSQILASGRADRIRQVIIRGADGATDDTLTVDLSAGLSIPDGIDYDGGKAGWDTLVVRGGPVQSSQTVTQLSPHDGILDFSGLQIRYAGLEPITDTAPAATYTINATGGGEEIMVVNGPLAGGTQTTQVNSGGSGTFELVNFANKTDVTINGVGGADLFTVNNSTPAAGLTILRLQGGALADRFTVTPSSTVTYFVNGGAPLPPGTGDTLIVSLAGVTSPALSIASDANGLQGSFTFGNRQPVNFAQVETLNPSDLFITKAGPATLTAGNVATYTVTVTNNGPNDAAVVQMTDAVPAGMTFVSATAPAGTTCTTPAVGATGTVSCTTPALLNGQSLVYTLQFRLAPNTPSGTVVTNVASVGSGTSETNPGDNSASRPSVTDVAADLAVTKSGPATSTPSTNATYTIVLTNNGPSTAQNVTLSDPLPAGMTFVSLAAPAGFACTTPAVGSGGTVSCSAVSLTPAAPATFTLVARFGATAPATVMNTVTVGTATPDAVPANNAATATTNVAAAPGADVAITKTASAPTATNGTNITYTIGVTNNGPASATNVTVTDVLPLGSTFVSATPTQGTCSGTTTVTCAAGTLASGASMSIALVITAPATGAAVSNTANVTATEADANGANNAATSTVTLIAPSADLAVTKSGPATAPASTNATYTIVLTNNGPNTAQTVTLTDVLPAGMTFVSLTPAAGFTCTTPAAGSGGTVSCSAVSLNAAATATFTLVARFGATAPATVTNTVNVGAATADPNAANNTASTTTSVSAAPSADVAITKTASAPAVAAGTNITYTIAVTNNGPASATGVTITDVLPAGSTFVSATPTQGTCSGTATVTCAAGTLASGSTMSVALVVTAPATGAAVANTATVTATEADANPANNSATSNVTLTAAAAIPTLSELMLFALAALLGAVAVLKLK